MSNEQKAQLDRYFTDANAKLAALPERLAAEKEQAEIDGRQPFPIMPLIEVDPQTILRALESIKDVPDSVADTVGTWRRVCMRQDIPFAVPCEQLLAVLALRK